MMMAKQLLALSSESELTTAGTGGTSEIPKAKAKPQKCIVYWVDEKKISRVPLSAVCCQEDAVEGITTDVMWVGTGPFKGRIVKISDNLQELKAVQEAIERDIAEELANDQLDSPLSPSTSHFSSKGRKIHKSKKALSDADSDSEVPQKSPKRRKKSLVTHKSPKKSLIVTQKSPKKSLIVTQKSPKKSLVEKGQTQLQAKLIAKQSMCKQLFEDNNEELQNVLAQFENIHEFSALDGLARAVEVANDCTIQEDDITLYNIGETSSGEEQLHDKIGALEAEICCLQNEVDELREENKSLKEKLEENGLPTDLKYFGLRVTPSKVTFLKKLTALAELSMAECKDGQPVACLDEVKKTNSALPVSTTPIHYDTVAGPSTKPSEVTPGAAVATEVTPRRDGVATEVTPRAGVDKSDMVELLKGSGVYITVGERTSVLLKGKRGASVMLRKILEVLFTKRELALGCAVGAVSSKSTPLDNKRITVAKSFVLLHCKKNGIPVPSEKEMNVIINSKCVSTRRQEKKVHTTAK